MQVGDSSSRKETEFYLFLVDMVHRFCPYLYNYMPIYGIHEIARANRTEKHMSDVAKQREARENASVD